MLRSNRMQVRIVLHGEQRHLRHREWRRSVDSLTVEAA
jgi:hypothetical protein